MPAVLQRRLRAIPFAPAPEQNLRRLIVLPAPEFQRVFPAALAALPFFTSLAHADLLLAPVSANFEKRT